MVNRGLIPTYFAVKLLCLIMVFQAMAAEDITSERDMSVGRTAMSVIAGQVISTPPGQALMRDLKTTCDGNDVYCYQAQGAYETPGGTVPLTWNIKLEFNQPYQAYQDIPLSPLWLESHVQRDEATGGEVYYRQSQSRNILYGRVVIKMLANGVLLTLSETTPILESEASQIQFALKRWRVFIDAARTFGILTAPRFEIIARGGNRSGQVLAHGDVLKFVTNFDHPETLTLDVNGRPFGSKQGDPFEIQIQIANYHQPLVSLQGPGLSKTAYGYRLETRRDTNALTFSFDSKALKQYREVFPAGPVISLGTTIRIADREQKVFIQPSPWHMVISRFEILQVGAQSARRHRVSEGQPPYPGYRLNSFTKLQGKLLDAWEKSLYPAVQAGHSFRPNQSVVMGWAKNDANGHTFDTAEDDLSQGLRPIPGYNAEAVLQACIDVEILVDPTVEMKERPGTGELEIDPDATVNAWEEQRRIWRDYQVDIIQLSIHEVDPSGTNMRLPAKSAQAIPSPLPERHAGRNRLSDYFNLKRMDIEHMELVYEPVAPRIIFGPLRNAGIYEIRFKCRIQRGSNAEDFQEADVAIRIKAVRSGFDTEMLLFQTTRSAEGLR